MVLPFLSGFLGFYWRSSNWPQLRLLGRRRTRHLSLGFSTVMLFFPALISFLVGERGGDGGGLFMNGFGWPLVNLVVFGVILSETSVDERLSRDYRKEFLVTFFCTLVLELLYFPDFSLFGFSLCGILFWFAVVQLGSYMDVPELGFDSPESLYAIIVNPVKHILSERKSRKIALFLLINTAYMVVEFVAGFMSNSLGLISDACHMLFDCAALAIGLYASYISRLPANSQFNYGRGRFEVLSGYVNAVFLVLVGALIVLESLERILDPQEISTNSLLTVSVGGLMVNVVGLIFFHEEHHHAHGGVGACSHSHSHSHQDDRHHHHCMHDHQETQPDELQCISAHGSSSHEKPCSGDDHSYHKHEGHQPRGQTSEGIKDTDHHHSLNAHHDLNGRTEHDIHCHGDQHHHHVDEHVPVNSKDHKHSHCHESHTQNTLHHLEHDRTECHHDHHIDAHQQKHNDHHHLANDHNNVKSKDNERFHCHGQHAQRESHGDKEDCCNNGCHSSLESNSLGSKGLLSGVEDGMFEPPRKHHHVDHNMEGIFLHVLADTMGSVGVVISTLLIKYKGWLVADPASSIFISVLIISSVIPLLKNSAEILLQRVPRAYEEDLKAALNDISKIGGVCGVQNAHLWSFTNMDIVGTLHLHILAEADKVSIKEKVSNILQDAGVKDMTVQIERLRSNGGQAILLCGSWFREFLVFLH
ncbi:Metal tolerance protein 8 [Acorus calamus]|uniref:Metal tolerance protein 8 n=1 Tax=Acorus calamus TaxID=4465 RepID=A0AAV9EV06_ACOCL|nr:Metal tolerance protein 8 [Acorus calamus]